MHRIKRLGLTLLALFAFTAFAAVVASAETPEILVLEGNVLELQGEFCSNESEKPQLINLLGLKTVGATKACISLKSCDPLAGAEKDTSLCKDIPIIFTGVKQGEASCRSENSKGEKDPVETVLALLDLHLSSETTSGKVLQPILLAQTLGMLIAEEEVKFNCALLKVKVTGVVACLVGPGLTNTINFEVLCRVNAATHDRETGTCTVLCSEFVGILGLLTEYGGTEKLDAWELVHLLGKFNKDVFIDD